MRFFKITIFALLFTTTLHAQFRLSPYFWEYYGVKSDSLLVIPKILTDPSLIEDGAIRYNLSTLTMQLRRSGAWVDISTGASNTLQTVTDNGNVTTNRIGIKTAFAPLAPIHVGNYNVMISSDAQILLSRRIDDTGSGNAHGFADNSVINRSGTIGYASYDDFIKYRGSANQDHHVAYQSRPVISSTGLFNDLYGGFHQIKIDSGAHLIRDNGWQALPPLLSNGSLVDSAFGFSALHYPNQSKRYSFFSDGGAQFYNGGMIQTNGMLRITGATNTNAQRLGTATEIYYDSDTLTTYIQTKTFTDSKYYPVTMQGGNGVANRYSYFTLKGDSAFLRTSNGQKVVFYLYGSSFIRDSQKIGGNLLPPRATLDVNGNVRIANVPAGVTSNQVLVYGSDSTIRQATLPVGSADNVAALNVLDTSLRTVFVKGYYSPGDGGGGQFYWDATNTATANGGTIFKPTAITTGRWLRVVDSVYNILWFGAKRDGTTDNSTVWNTIMGLNSTSTLNVYVPAGYYNGTFNVARDNANIVGQAMPQISADTTRLINGSVLMGTFTASGNNCYFRNLGADMGSFVVSTLKSGTSNDAFTVKNPVFSGPKFNNRVENIIGLNSSPSAAFHSVLIEAQKDGWARNITGVYGFFGVVFKTENFTCDNITGISNSQVGVFFKGDGYAPLRNTNATNIRAITPLAGSSYFIQGAVSVWNGSGGDGIVDGVNISNVVVRNGQESFTINATTGNPIKNVNISNVQLFTPNDEGFSTSGLIHNIVVDNIMIWRPATNIGFETRTGATDFTVTNLLALVDNAPSGNPGIVLAGKTRFNNITVTQYNDSSLIGKIFIRGVPIDYGKYFGTLILDAGGTFTNSEWNLTKTLAQTITGTWIMNNTTLFLDAPNQTNSKGFTAQGRAIQGLKYISSVPSVDTVFLNKNGGLVQVGDSALLNGAFSVYGSTRLKSATGVTEILTDSSVRLASTEFVKAQKYESRFPNVNLITGSYTVGFSEKIINVNNSGNIVINLPLAAAQQGRTIVIKKISNNANTITLTPASGTIETAATLVMSTYLGTRVIYNDGTNWWVQ